VSVARVGERGLFDAVAAAGLSCIVNSNTADQKAAQSTGNFMSRLKLRTRLCFPLLLFMAASTVKATTLYVNCGGKAGLTTIGTALKALQYSEGHAPSTINVSGAYHENVVIQSLERVTLNAINGGSVPMHLAVAWMLF
jgi:hypothetical protein